MTVEKGKSVNKIVLINIFCTLVIQGMNFITMPIFSRMMGPLNYGEVSVFLTWANVASIIFSLETADAIAVARVNFKEEQQEAFQSSIMFFSCLSFLICGIFAIIVTQLFRQQLGRSLVWVLLMLAYSWGSYFVNFINAKLSLEFKAVSHAIISISLALLTTVTSYFLIREMPSDTNYYGRIISLSAVYVVYGIAICAYLYVGGRKLVSREYWAFTLPITIPTIFHLLAMQILGQCDVLMLQGMLSTYSVGIYSLARSFSSVISIIYGSFNNSWVPFYYEYSKNLEFDEMRRKAVNYVELFTVICIGFVFLAKEVFQVFASLDFQTALPIIPVFVMGFYFVFLYSFAVNYEILNRKTKTIAICTVITAVINIILNYVLIKKYGYVGAVYATTISHSIQFAIHYAYARFGIKGQFPFRFRMFAVGFLSLAGCCLLWILLQNAVIVRWGIGIALGVYLLIKIIKRRSIF